MAKTAEELKLESIAKQFQFRTRLKSEGIELYRQALAEHVEYSDVNLAKDIRKGIVKNPPNSAMALAFANIK